MNILFLTYFFPPRKAIACVRTYELCKGLLRQGHRVHVATVPVDGSGEEQPADWAEFLVNPMFTCTRIPSRWRSLHDGLPIGELRNLRVRLKSLLNRVCAKATILCGFDPFLPWAWAAWRALARASRHEKYDCVLVSAGPFSTLMPAQALAGRLRVPLILDYRDVWNGAPHTRRRLSTRWLERWILGKASLLVSISPSCLASIRGPLQVPSLVITNGIGADVEAFSRNAVRTCPTSYIAYAGAFYPPKRSAEPIIKALALANRTPTSEERRLRFVYAGPSSAYVEDVAGTEGMTDRVSCQGLLPRSDVFKLLATSLCTIVVTSVEKTALLPDRGIVTGKIFEAIALAPWVLVISPEDSDVRSLTAHCPHVKHFHGYQVDEIARWLTKLPSEPSTLEQNKSTCYFSWSLLAARFEAAVLAAIQQTTESSGDRIETLRSR